MGELSGPCGEEWNEANPVHIPFRDTLLRGDPVNRSRWGETKLSSDPSTVILDVVVEGSLGIERFAVPVTCTSSKVPLASSLVSSGVRCHR